MPGANKMCIQTKLFYEFKKWAARSPAVQCPTNNKPQYEVTIFFDELEKYVMYPSYYFLPTVLWTHQI